MQGLVDSAPLGVGQLAARLRLERSDSAQTTSSLYPRTQHTLSFEPSGFGFRPPTSSTLQKLSFVIRLILNTLNVDQSFVSVLFTVTLLPDPYRNSQHHLKQWSCAGKPAQGVSDSHMQRQTSDPCSPSQQHAAEVRTPWNSLVSLHGAVACGLLIVHCSTTTPTAGILRYALL